MIQVTPQMRLVVALEPVDGRLGIDGLGRVCRSVLDVEPLDGTLVVFRCRSGKTLRLLAYDGQGFWICKKRLSSGRFKHWPTATDSAASRQLLAHELQALIWGGDPDRAQAAPMWRRLDMPAEVRAD
jgi:transposase